MRLVIALLMAGFTALAPAQAAAQNGRVLVMPFEISPKAEQGTTYWMGEAAALLVADALQARGYPVFTRA